MLMLITEHFIKDYAIEGFRKINMPIMHIIIYYALEDQGNTAYNPLKHIISVYRSTERELNCVFFVK